MPSSRYGLQMLSQCCLLPSSIRKGTCVHRAAGRPILDALRACLPRSITYISDICLMVSKWWRLVAEGQGMVAGDTSGESLLPAQHSPVSELEETDPRSGGKQLVDSSCVRLSNVGRRSGRASASLVDIYYLVTRGRLPR
ncbi:hypothetical protein FA13DRAFT_1726121 [Coprinellus micaceus]|uniref:Uncharacterized protein n=1 Tax=Coprinellus micaceus TaxID=71717 RepID=A0A4Y7TWW5_COPMI|nr:hypothetical protein FA13DRAFT_1726121 [Coprinellus micaceus]